MLQFIFQEGDMIAPIARLNTVVNMWDCFILLLLSLLPLLGRNRAIHISAVTAIAFSFLVPFAFDLMVISKLIGKEWICRENRGILENEYLHSFARITCST